MMPSTRGHASLAGEATGNKQQAVGGIGGHAHGHAAGGGVDEPFGGAALEVAAEESLANRSSA
jgi:hypothetical protein